MLKQDGNYRDHFHFAFKIAHSTIIARPPSSITALLANDKSLLAGQPIICKEYDCAQTPDVLIGISIHCFHDSRILEPMYFWLYINADADIFLLRHIERDSIECCRSIDSISTQHRATVRLRFRQYIRNYINLADMTVTRSSKNAHIVKTPVDYIEDELHMRQQAE